MTVKTQHISFSHRLFVGFSTSQKNPLAAYAPAHEPGAVLSVLNGTGPNGRITKVNVDAAPAASAAAAPNTAPATGAAAVDLVLRICDRYAASRGPAYLYSL
ncbi:hypothetical protein PI124_g1779 [Phytophthora idaei]|nr:hypothetical protein PI125_g11486 [Phytophthora idaei]KAG3152046.1 hypothetical protein PI126_g10720 [Phytophthora idaei]KAG3253696.1 hypothetical protein PI124_g1779 [Phytophthora idaei]